MTKRDDKIEELEDWRIKKEIEDGIREGISRKVRAICMTATSAALGVVYTLGSFAYNNLEALAAAVKAFLTVNRGGQ